MEKLNKLNRKKIGLILLLAAVFLLMILYIAAALYFNGHFMFRTTINGLKGTGKTVQEIEEAMLEQINGYELTIVQRGNQQEVLKGSKIELKPVFDGSLREELEARSGFTWIASLFKDTEISVETMVTYDEALFDQEVNALDCLNRAKVQRPENARLSKYSRKNGYKIIPEKQGNMLRSKRFKTLVKEAVTTLQQRISLEDENCYVKPKYTVDSPEVKALAETMNLYTSAAITYEFGKNREKLDGEQIHTWLSVSKDHQVLLDEEKLSAYVEELAAKYNTAYQAKELKTSYGPTVTISKGDYGWRMNQDEEKAQLMGEIKAGQTVAREPHYSQRGSSFGANDYGDTYVEINLTAQHLFFYKNGSLLVDSDFVSGNLSKGWGTPTGAYGITYTQRDATLRGEDYETPVDYWMPFNGGVGMHDAAWRGDFGGNYYKTSGSHGCINLPPSVAKKIFESIKTGDPVLVYELGGTESRKAREQDNANAVIAAINAIGDVSLENRAAVDHARAMYETLKPEEKSFVSNYDMLIRAEAVLAQLQAEQLPASQEPEQPPAGPPEAPVNGGENPPAE